ncbi:MAG: trypco2 family protein [Acidobacteriota bacterium]
MSEGIELADAIAELRSQLSRAVKEGEWKSLRFEIEKLELELEVVATKGQKVEAGAEAGVKFWLLGSGKVSGKGELSEGASASQKITLTLRPKDPKTGKTPDLTRDR